MNRRRDLRWLVAADDRRVSDTAPAVGAGARFQAGLQLMRVRRIAGQDAITADNSAVYFIEPDFMTVLDRFRFFTATDNIRV